MKKKIGTKSTYHVKFADLINTLLGYKVIPIDENSEEDKLLIESLRNSIKKVLRNYGRNGTREFIAKRPNDISDNTDKGPCLEEEIVKTFNSLLHDNPQNLEAKRASPRVGYPDIVIYKKGKDFCYVDMKVSSRRAKGSARDIYLSPGPITEMDTSFTKHDEIKLDFIARKGNLYQKVKADARHIIILVKVERVGETIVNGERSGRWKLKGAWIIDISDLRMKTKIEFNASFKDLDLCKQWVVSEL